MVSTLPRPLREVLERALGTSTSDAQPLGGGDISDAYAVALDDGRGVFVKTRPGGGAMFEAEADGLAWLAEANAVRIPRVLAVGSEDVPFLALELVRSAPHARDHDERLGQGLAALHRFGAPSFGYARDNFIGSLPQRGDPCDDWPEFYRTRRLDPLVRAAHREGDLPASTLARFDRLYRVLADRTGPPEPPARLHGDLWAGNRLCDEHGHPVLIDPAVYGGHREIDLAMMRLFGGFSARCFAAYAEAYPLAPGHEDRIPLYQLYPLLVHLNLFGRAYLGQIERALDQVS